ncbi:MAG: hypothetical protein MUP98_10575 [Candidatus Aminicenantes bacterium]|nr:hypothetical protein [Candidatus Aminicenantes bacterium]
MRYSAGSKVDLKIELKVEIFHRPTGRKIPLEFNIVESGEMGQDDTLLMKIEFPYVEPDFYTLFITLRDPNLNLEAVTSRTFRIR